MPPSSSAATRSDEDDDDHAPSSDPLAEISDSDLVNDEQHEPELEEVEEQEEEGNGNGDYEEEEVELEEEEYEEIEVEEEEEIEEEVEVEEEEEEEEEEEDLLDSSSQLNDKQKDISQDLELDGNDMQLGSCSTPGKSELGLPCTLIEDCVRNSKFKGPLNEKLTLQEELDVNYKDSKCLKSGEHLITNGENGSPESVVKKDTEAVAMKKNSKEISKPLIDSKVHLCNSGFMANDTTRPSSITGNVSNALATKGCSGMKVNGILDSKEELKPIEMQTEDDKKQTASRLFTSEIRTRSLSPSAEFKDRNKRQAVICDFFAKGWCIRGSSCRFLHLNNETDNAKEQLEGDAAAGNFSKGDQSNEGSRKIIERTKLPDFPYLMASSIGNDASCSRHFPLERNLALENAESRSLHQLDDKHNSSSFLREDLSRGVCPDTPQFPSPEDDLGISSSKDVGIENLRRHWPAADYGSYTSPINKGSSPLFQNNLLPEPRSSSSGLAVTPIRYCGGNLPSYLSSLDNLKYIRGQYVHSSSFDGSLPISGMLTSHQVSAWTGPSSSFSSFLDTSPLGPQKLLDSHRHYSTSRSSSLLKSASPLSGSEPENLPLTSASGYPLHYAEYKAKIASNDWEPSVPFQPSFFVTHTTESSPGSQYDPLRDSINLPATGYKLPLKFSFVRQDTPSLDMLHQPAYGISLLSHTLGPEHNVKSTSSLHSRLHENMLDNNSHAPRKDLFPTGIVIGGTCAVNEQKGTMPKEEDTSSTGHLKDVPNTSKSDADRDSRNRNDGPRRIKDLKVGRIRQKNEADVKKKTDGESRALRHFRAALVDVVKELLKPTWREGHLSKDAHNTIVKKAVEKVLSTLQHRQIPTTMELVKQYLSSSQPKIAKLVEGYCTKYGKS